MNVKQKLDDYLGEDYSKFLTPLALIIILGLATGLAMVSNPVEKENINQTNSTDSNEKIQNLTKYQTVFVDCPTKYLQACTKLSKQGTEKVNFLRVENDTIYLGMTDNRTMVAELQENQSKTTLIRIEEPGK